MHAINSGYTNNIDVEYELKIMKYTHFFLNIYHFQIDDNYNNLLSTL